MGRGPDRGRAGWALRVRRPPRRFGLLLAAGAVGVALAVLWAATASAFPENCTSNSDGTQSCSGSGSDSYPRSFVCVAGTTSYFEDSYLPADAQNPKLTSVVFKPNPPCTGATVSAVTVDPWPASTQRPDNKPILPPAGKAIFRFRWTVTVPSGSTPIGDMGVTWSISWTKPAGYDLSVKFVSPPASAQLGSDIPYQVEVTNSGPSESAPAQLLVYPDFRLAPSSDHSNVVISPGGPHGRVTVPALGKDKSVDYTVIAEVGHTDKFLSLGTARFAAIITRDGDPTDEPHSDLSTGDDVSWATTQVVIDGVSVGDSPCAVVQKAADSTAGCTLAHGHATSFAGSASGDVKRVQIAIESAGKGAHAARSNPCRALTGSSGRLQSGASTKGVCAAVRWLTAKGTKHWRYALRHSLPPGNYVLYTRPVTPVGTPVAGFTAARQNRIAFSVR